MNWKHLLWIVPVVLAVGFCTGVWLDLAAHDECMVVLLSSISSLAACEEAQNACVSGTITEECFVAVRQAAKIRLLS